MSEFELTAQPRTDVGKGASRRLRRAGKLPGIVYGGQKDPVNVLFDHDLVLHQLENEAFYSHILKLKLPSGDESVVLKDVQQHPAKPKLLHVDLLRVSATHEITMTVPIHFLNEEECPGVKAGGSISRLIDELEISCLPKNLPEYVPVDLADLELDQSLHLSDVKLPEGVELTTQLDEDTDQQVVSVQIYTAPAEEEEEAGAEEGLEAASEEGEEEGAGEEEESSED